MKLFKNKADEIRSGWKIVIVLGLYGVFQFVFSMLFGIIYGGIFAISNGRTVSTTDIQVEITRIMTTGKYSQVISQGVDFAILLLVLLFILKKIDKKDFRKIGLVKMSSHLKELLYGLLLGAASMTCIFFILYFKGDITLSNSLSSPKFIPATFTGLIVFIIVGIKEELLSRGYCITALNSMGKPWLSIIISSLIFSSLHLFNPNVKMLGLFNIVIVGLLFGYMYVKTENLWMPIGYHITWNYFQGNIFGFPVSGTSPSGIYTFSNVKDNIFTGGAFGPEAGILTTIVIIIGAVVVWEITKIENRPQMFIEKN